MKHVTACRGKIKKHMIGYVIAALFPSFYISLTSHTSLHDPPKISAFVIKRHKITFRKYFSTFFRGSVGHVYRLCKALCPFRHKIRVGRKIRDEEGAEN